VKKNGTVGERTDGEERKQQFGMQEIQTGQGAAMYTFFPISCASNSSVKEYPINELIELSIA
jgi:hypothetical protein